jgi:hypothetical protein
MATWRLWMLWLASSSRAWSFSCCSRKCLHRGVVPWKRDVRQGNTRVARTTHNAHNAHDMKDKVPVDFHERVDGVGEPLVLFDDAR